MWLQIIQTHHTRIRRILYICCMYIYEDVTWQICRRCAAALDKSSKHNIHVYAPPYVFTIQMYIMVSDDKSIGTALQRRKNYPSIPHTCVRSTLRVFFIYVYNRVSDEKSLGAALQRRTHHLNTPYRYTPHPMYLWCIGNRITNPYVTANHPHTAHVWI